jgi:AAA15 family ATPase/GTPase
LFFVPTIREAVLFTRENGEIKLGPDFKEGKGLEKKTRENALFLSVAAQFNGETAKKMLEWFDNLRIIPGIDGDGYHTFTIFKLDDSEYKEFITKFLQEADLGIKEIIKKTTRINEDEINTIHQKYNARNEPVSDEKFSLTGNESAGTLALFGLSAPIYNTMKTGKILVVDELTSKLHPLLTKAIIEAFHLYHFDSGGGESMPSKAQLIFVSHDTSILTSQLFRRDQLWFTQKNEYGATDLYSLEEYRIRKDASFNKDYIMGKYGAVPFIGNIESLFSSL